MTGIAISGGGLRSRLRTPPTSVGDKVQLKRAVVLGVLMCALAVASLAVVVYDFGAPHSEKTTCTNPAPVVYFTIYESDSSPYEGMNGSYFHLSEPWPVMNVCTGETVEIHVENVASSEAHGFAIYNYYEPGVVLQPGQSANVTFVADQAGTFLVYCNVICAIHPYMENGRLVVA